MAKIIDLKIQNSETVLKTNQEIFGHISERRRGVVRELKEGFERFMAQTEHFVGSEIFSEASKFSPNIAAGSGVAVIGVVLADQRPKLQCWILQEGFFLPWDCCLQAGLSF